MTVGEVLRRSADHLGAKGSDTPRLDAELLVAHALGVARIDLYMQFDRILADAMAPAMPKLHTKPNPQTPGIPT